MAGRTDKRLPLALGILALVAALIVFLLLPHEEPEPMAVFTDAGTETRETTGAAPPVRWPVLRLTPLHVEKGPTLPGGRVDGRVVSAVTGTGAKNPLLTFDVDGAAVEVRGDGSGAFSFTPPRAGSFRLASVHAPGFEAFQPEWGQSDVWLMAEADRVVSGVVFFLWPLHPQRLRVIDEAGSPVAGAEASVIEALGGILPAPRVTDERGEVGFEISGDMLIEARHPTKGTGRTRLYGRDKGTPLVVLKLKTDAGETPRMKISGRVEDATGAPVPDAPVRAALSHFVHLGSHEELIPEPQTVTDPNGAFELQPLDDTEYDVHATLGRLSGRVDAVHAGKRDVVVRVSEGRRLTGDVVDALTGTPLSLVNLSLRQKRGALELYDERSLSVVDPAGRFVIDALATGNYELYVSAFEHEPQMLPLEIGATDPPPLHVKLERGSLVAGRVRDRQTLKPIQGAFVTVEGRDLAGTGLGSVVSAVTDALGKFRLMGLPRGTSSLEILADGYDMQIVAGVEPKEDAQPVEVLLTPVKPGAAQSVELVGIGAVLSAEDDVLVVGEVFPGSGAAEAGLRAGDRVATLDGEAVVKLGFAGSIGKIRGVENTAIELGLRRGDGGLQTVRVVRRRFTR